jgi:LasA protease
MVNVLKRKNLIQSKTTSSVNISRALSFIRIILVSIFVVVTNAACVSSGYFIAPHASPTIPPEMAMLGNTAIPLENLPTSTPAPTDPPLPTRTPLVLDSPTPSPSPSPTIPANAPPLLYYVQAADTLPVIAVRFNVSPGEITSPDPIVTDTLLTPGQLLIIPHRLANTTTSQHILPDSELVYSPSAIDFDIDAYVKKAGGKLSGYKEWLKSTGTNTGAQIIQRVALENSINPRLLLALLEYNSHWVTGQPENQNQEDYPMGLIDLNEKGLYRQMVWAVNQLSVGYFNWREGRIIELGFADDGYSTRLAPDLNAGSVALQYFFSKLYDSNTWLTAIDLKNGFPALYERMFGNPWERAQNVEPLYPPGLTQPPLILPFEMNQRWSYTGGPHGAWEAEGSYAALDFAPPSSDSGCIPSNAWVVASASGLVVRSGNGVIVLDLDGDGYEQTGWALLYLHVSAESAVPVGTWVGMGDHLGHPSCEGGHATGTHVHIARKFNGEWIAADGPMGFNLSGWVAHADTTAYYGNLIRGEDEVIANVGSSGTSILQRTIDDPVNP